MIKHHGISKSDRIKLYKLIVARSDVTAALFSTRLFIKTVKSMSDDGFIPLQESIIVSYSRPFTRNKPYGSLDSKMVSFLDKKFQKLHHMIIDHRNKIVAHSDLKYKKVQIVPPGASKIKGVPTNSTVAVQLSIPKLTINTFRNVEKLCLSVGGKLDKDIDDLLAKTYEKIKLPKKPFDLL